ncbi:MAG: cytochrome c oxidase assembly protein, partial [Gemmatimonadales bacterium]
LTVAGTALGKNTQDILRRFSTMAGSAFLLVVASGIINALIRVQTPEDLASPYGALLAVKTLGAIGLGVIGYLHRTRVIPLLGLTAGTGASRGLLWRLVGVELLIMGAVSGLAAALARTPTPGGEEIRPALTPAEILTGYLLPPEPAAEQWFTVWRPDWLWITAAAFAAFLYQHAARRLNKRGAGWPWLRSAAWLAGLGLLVFFTSGGPSVYGRVLFSAHALDHMALATIIPVLLVLGAPVTLARRVLAPRVDGSTGPHEWIESVSGSRFAAIVTHPLAAAAVMAASMLLFYSTDAYGFALREHAGHELMSVYFVTVGCLFVLSMLGTGTLGRRFTYPARLAALAATMAFYTVFGITVMRSTVLIQPGWFTELGRDWGLPALQDQQLAGAILWGFGAIPAALMAIAVLIMRSRTLQTRGPGSQPSGASNSSAVPSPEAHP